jgi:nicotinamidase-related amidase
LYDISMAETLPSTNHDFNASSQSAAPGGQMAFVVDVQSFDMMGREDAQAYADKLGAAVEDLRARGVPVTWLSMSDRNELIPPENTTGGPPKRRAFDAKIGHEFYGTQEWAHNADIYARFWAEHGPRTDEAIYCKYFKSAFVVPENADGNPAYRQILEGENSTIVDGKPKPFDKTDKAFQSRPTFKQFLEQQGINKLILMGAVSSHCVSETAASAIQKHIDPMICSDLVLSWDGDQEAKIDRNISRLRFQDGAAAASPLDYHTNCIREKLNIISGQQKDARNISDDDAEVIRNTRIERYIDLSRRLPPRQDNNIAASIPVAAPVAPALQL